jgi:acylphosphatase
MVVGWPRLSEKPSAAVPRLRILIRGRVQGVFFRASIVDLAGRLGVVGWVRNRTDGSVQVVAQGPDVALDALREYCEVGPASARVTSVEVTPETETGEFRSFGPRPDY